MSTYAPELYLIAVSVVFGVGMVLFALYEGRRLDRKWGKPRD